jgi:hypothetical protein
MKPFINNFDDIMDLLDNQVFTPHFEIVEIRKYRNEVPDTIQGLDFMWTCLLRNNTAADLHL